MKASFSISKTGSFTVWESGQLDSKGTRGYAITVAGPGGEKLESIFDRSPDTSNRHALFFADVGTVLCGCNFFPVSTEASVYGAGLPTPGISEGFKFILELQEIDHLFTENVQGRAVPRYRATPLIVVRGSAPELSELAEFMKRCISAQSQYQQYEEMFDAPIAKALPAREHQKMFWGIARKGREADEESDNRGYPS